MLHFREELEELKSKLLEMGGLVESAIHNSIYALVERDEERAKEVMWKEAQVNQKEMEIDDLCNFTLTYCNGCFVDHQIDPGGTNFSIRCDQLLASLLAISHVDSV